MERFEGNYLDEDELLQQQQILHPQQTVVNEAELLAAQAAAEAAAAQQLQQPGGAFNNVGQGLNGKYRDMMMQYWQETINSIEHDDHDFKNHQLPLARIKKVMKTDEDVRMISAEAPILFAKGCDVFITELTMRAWIHAEENKRRTLQKSDIAAALTKSDMFDFLIDVVPREEEKPKKAYTQSRPNYINHQPTQPNDHQLLQHLPQRPQPQGQAQNNIHHEQIHQQTHQDKESPSLKREEDILQHQLLQQQMMQQQLIQQQKQGSQEGNGIHNEKITNNDQTNEGPTSNGPTDSYQNFPNFNPGYQGSF